MDNWKNASRSRCYLKILINSLEDSFDAIKELKYEENQYLKWSGTADSITKDLKANLEKEINQIKKKYRLYYMEYANTTADLTKLFKKELENYTYTLRRLNSNYPNLGILDSCCLEKMSEHLKLVLNNGWHKDKSLSKKQIDISKGKASRVVFGELETELFSLSIIASKLYKKELSQKEISKLMVLVDKSF